MDIRVKYLYLFVIGALGALNLVGLAVVSLMPAIDRWSRRFFSVFFTLLLAGVILFLFGEIIFEQPGLNEVRATTYFFESVLVSAPVPMLTIYLLHCCSERFKGSLLLRTSLALWAFFFVMAGIAQLVPGFYFVTQDNVFLCGPLYPLLILPLVLAMLLNVCATIRRRTKLTTRRYLAFLVYLLPLTLALLIHLFQSNFLLVDSCISVCALVMFTLVVFEQVEYHVGQQGEIARQRASIAVLQMRPHFIYNTMTSIYYLCDQDPAKAQQVTLDFTSYLRKNLAAIASDDAIPFSEELEHTRAYLAVEQVQFEDLLIVDYDTPHTDFQVPALTLQPIVENAVKHGLDPDSGPLHVTIRTRKVGSYSEIVVKDDGPGFDVAVVAEPNTTLANIRQRLEMMCGGRLQITSGANGTVVTITIG